MNKVEAEFLKAVSLGSQIIAMLGIYKLANRWFKDKVRIIMFHGVTKKHDPITNFDQKHIERKKLDRFIELLKKEWIFISLDQFLAYAEGRTKLPENAIHITFDDGYENCYMELFPLLKKYEIPATIFLPTVYTGRKEIAWYDAVTYLIAETSEAEIVVDQKVYKLTSQEQKIAAIAEVKKKIRDSPKKRESVLEELEHATKVKRSSCKNENFLFMSWEQCQEMQKHGVIFGSHSVHHQIMTAQTEDEIKKELQESKKIIEEKLAVPCDYFAYPFGESNIKMQTLLREAGYNAGFTTTYGANKRTADKSVLSRISLNNWYDEHILLLTLFCNFPVFHHWLLEKYSRIRRIL
ncbi:MAG: polysaccharide deacetylase family protein [Nanoarchaeota archaeon]